MKKRSGFTMIEIALFLALTGALFFGIAAGMNNSIYQQRYNDSVQNFADFLRNVYSEVENVQGIGNGRSEQAIYGKLVTFGEKKNFSGENNSNSSIFIYDVVGDASNSISASEGVLKSLQALGANVVVQDSQTSSWSPAGLAEAYNSKWGAAIEKENSHDLFKGALLIVRSPSSGTIYTYVKKDNTIEVNEALNSSFSEGLGNLLLSSLSNDSFKIEQADFCLNPNGDSNFSGMRRNVRIKSNAHNSSSVVLPTDEESVCENIY